MEIDDRRNQGVYRARFEDVVEGGCFEAMGTQGVLLKIARGRD